jgi:hypothetical protein
MLKTVPSAASRKKTVVGVVIWKSNNLGI